MSLPDSLQQKLQDERKSLNIRMDAFFPCQTKVMSTPEVVYWIAPARLLSDQLVNIFIQEIAPLFPILHRPMFLSLYEKYVACPRAISDETSLAQLNLVFSIAAQSSNVWSLFCDSEILTDQKNRRRTQSTLAYSNPSGNLHSSRL
jgi:hypothetical protein